MSKLNWEHFEKLIDESWHQDLRPFIESEECYKIYQHLKSLQKNEVIPKSNLLWRPFMECKKDNLKVVFIGLSPYHTRNGTVDIADGLAFSTQQKKAPPSLELLLNAVENDLGATSLKRTNDLKHWAGQGVLLLNAGMTTSFQKAGNHVDLWYPFHKYMFDNVYSKQQGLIFVYFGKEAQKLSKLETPFMHYNKLVEHPAAAARMNREFEHKNLFSFVNKLIAMDNKTPIEWMEYENKLPF